jgi:exonuclease VII small subunit
MSFTALETHVANIKIWKKDLNLDAPPQNTEDLFNWMKSELLNNIAPLLESQAKASMHELGEVFAELEEQGKALDEVIDQEEDYLQPEMAANLTATLVLGMFIADIIDGEGIQLDDELKNKKLQDAMKLYRQNSTILLDQIEAVTVVDDDEEEEDPNDDDTDDDTDETIIHGQGGDSALAVGGGEGATDGGGGDGGDGGDGAGSTDAAGSKGA